MNEFLNQPFPLWATLIAMGEIFVVGYYFKECQSKGLFRFHRKNNENTSNKGWSTMTDKLKLLPWKKLTGPQAQYRLIMYAIGITTTVGLLGGITFGYVFPALTDFQIYSDSVDLDKLSNATKNSGEVIWTMGKLGILGSIGPLIFGYWLQGKAWDFYDYIFRRLSLDIGYEQNTQPESKP